MAIKTIGRGYVGGERGGTGPEQKTTHYSDSLIAYIGRIELEANAARDDFNSHMCFVNALEQLPKSSLPPEDQRTARNLLERRVRETQPANIGIASSDGGSEAD